jgi:hypothetical protein
LKIEIKYASFLNMQYGYMRDPQSSVIRKCSVFGETGVLKF